MLKQLLMLLWVADSSLPSLVSRGMLIKHTLTHKLIWTTQGRERATRPSACEQRSRPMCIDGICLYANSWPGPKSRVRFLMISTLAIQQLKDSHSVRVPTLPAGVGGDSSYVSLPRYQVSKQSGIQVIDGKQDPTHDWCKHVQGPCLLACLRDRGAMSGPLLVWPLHCCLSASPSTDGCLPQWWIAGFRAQGLYHHYSHADDEQRGPHLHAWGRADGALMQWRRAHCAGSLHYHCCPAGDEQRRPPLHAWGRADGALMQWRRAHCTRSLHYHCCPASDEQRGPPLHAWGRADGALMQWRRAHCTRSLHYHCCLAGDEGPPLQAWGRADGALMQWLLVALQFELLQHLLMDDVDFRLLQGVPPLRPSAPSYRALTAAGKIPSLWDCSASQSVGPSSHEV